MLWLAMHMWALLAAAFAIGIAIGWWIWGAASRTPAPAPAEETLGSLNLDDETGDLSDTGPERSE